MRVLGLILGLFVSFGLQAGDGILKRRLPLLSLTNSSYSLYEPQRSSGEDIRSFEKRVATVRLNYTRKELSDMFQTNFWSLSVTIGYTDALGSAQSEVLTISNSVDPYVYSDYVEFPLASGSLGYAINVTGVTALAGSTSGSMSSVSTPQSSSQIPDDIELLLELKTTKVYKLDLAPATSDLPYIDMTASNYLHWSYREGAEEYDLEWVFIDKYSQEYAQVVAAEAAYSHNLASGFSLPFEIKEPSRVRLWGTHYTIDNTYPEGVLYYRVRSVNSFVDANGSTEDIRTGSWAYYKNPSLHVGKTTITAGTEFEPKRNWLYSVSYAEQGKSVSSVTFYDGGNKGRQGLAYNTSDDVTLVGESVYDNEGRESVTIVPAPVQGRTLGYKQNFNMAGAGNKFDEGEIEMAVTPPLSTLSGAAKYFSTSNNFNGDLFRDAVPNAGGYVFSQTLYRNDGSGRIESSGGVGDQFQATGIHAAKMYYGSPTIGELKRLFGDNVSDNAQGYRKDMVKDPNGQYSVTYYDKRGNAIATALAGDSPQNLRKLDYAEETIFTPLNDNNITMGSAKISEHTILNQVPGNVITLNYSVATAAEILSTQTFNLGGQELTLPEFCNTCRYHLHIEVQDAYGVVVTPVLDVPITPSAECAANNYSNTFNVTLPNIGEYRIIKTLTVDEASMLAAFQMNLANIDPQIEIDFINSYLEDLDVSGCYTDCHSYCAAQVRLNYIKENGQAAWDNLTKTQLLALLSDCYDEPCDMDESPEDPEDAITPSDMCDAQRQRMLNQISPGGFLYDNTSSSFWTSMPSSVTINSVSYTKTFLQNPANYTDAMAEALLSYHRENCFLQNNVCENWMATLQAMPGVVTALTDVSTNWSSSTTAYSSPWSIDPSHLYFGSTVGGNIASAVASYATANGFSYTTCSGTFSISSGNLFAYVDKLGDLVASRRSCDGDPMSGPEIIAMKKQLFSSIYNKIKWEKIKAGISCTFYTDINAVFLLPAVTEATLDGLIDDALVVITNGKTCEERAIDNVNNWVGSLSSGCITTLGISTAPIAYVSSQATALANSYTSNPNSTSVGLVQLMYNYSRHTCATNPAGLFFDPDPNGTITNAPGEVQYDAILSALQTSCGYSTGLLPFEITYPSEPAVSYSNYIPSELEGAIGELVDAVLDCSAGSTPTCFVTNEGYTSGTTIVTRKIFQLSGVSLSNGYTGTIRYVKQTSTGPGITLQKYYHYFDFTLSNGNCTFTVPKQSIGLHPDGHIMYNGLMDVRSLTAEILESNLDIVLDDSPLSIEWDYSQQNFPAPDQAYNYPYRRSTAVNASCTPTTGQSYGLGSIIDILTQGLSDLEEDCITTELLQGQAEAEVLYNSAIEELWSQYYEQVAACLGKATENFTMTYKIKEYQYTLYYYDLANNLVQTVPPQGVHPLTSSEVQTLLSDGPGVYVFPQHDMETRYQYNGMNTMIASYTPDGGHSDFYFDKLYRMRFSQNARQKGEKKASYTVYDELNRVAEAGEFQDDIDNTPQQFSDLLATSTKLDDLYYPREGLSPQMILASEAAAIDILDYTRTFYEKGYHIPTTALGTPSVTEAGLVAAFGSSGQENLRNAIGAVMHRQADYATNGDLVAGTEVITVLSYSYDPHKYVKKLVSTNYQENSLGTAHRTTDYSYDVLSGNTNEVVYQKGKWDEYRHRYHYDANNRVIRSFTSHNGTLWELDAKYFYYLNGGLARKELGQDQVQGIDYVYTLTSWIKGVNSSTLEVTRDMGKDGYLGDNQYGGADVFGYSLSYYQGDYLAIKDAAETPNVATNDYFADALAVRNLNTNADNGQNMGSLYNGNITNMVTAIRGLDENRVEILSNNYQYDQLQRIRQMKVYNATNLQTNNAFTGAALYRVSGSESAYQEDYTFDKNGNLLTLKRNGSGLNSAGTSTVPLAMDNFTYKYETQYTNTFTSNPTVKNRLSIVADAVSGDSYTGDIENGQLNSVANYQYDASGQLIKDLQEGVENIEWTVTGKVKRITFTPTAKTAGKHDMKFIYDPMDRRIAKMEYMNNDRSNIKYTYYAYDVSGNVMATYSRIKIISSTDASYRYYKDDILLIDHAVNGAERLGVENTSFPIERDLYRQAIGQTNLDAELQVGWSYYTNGSVAAPDYTKRIVNDKRYELANHLGNVLAVITDRKVGYDDGTYNVSTHVKTNGTQDGVRDNYIANVVEYCDYSPYGTMLHNRHGSEASSNYRYGFQGQEADDEIKGEGNSYNYTYRMHDPRIGRFFAIDPLTAKYPWYTPYQFSGNKLISCKELEGLEETSAILQQMQRYQSYERSKYENPGYPEALPLGAPLEDYIPYNQNRIIDHTRNPRTFWVPDCLSNGGGFCLFVQYGKWETHSTSSTQTTRDVNTVTNDTRVLGITPIRTINDPFVAGIDTPLPALTNTVVGCVNASFAIDLPPVDLPPLPAFPRINTTILSDNTVVSDNGLVITRTIVTQRTIQSTTNWRDPIANVVLVGFGTDITDNDFSRGLMLERYGILRNAVGNPRNLRFDSGASQFNIVGNFNRAYVSMGVLTDFNTTVRTTTETTTTVIVTSYNFMRNKDNPNNYIPTVNPIK